MPFDFSPLDLPGVTLIKPRVFRDERGFFLEKYQRTEFVKNDLAMDFVQDNFSHSERGVLRGLHYQLDPRPQGKLVGVIQGKIFDVAVDIRKGSPTYGQWIAEELSDVNHHLLYIPEGFAHGFLVLSDDADVVYKVTNEFDAKLDRGIAWNDPEIGIDWPDLTPILSEKDENLPNLIDCENNFIYKAGES